AGKGEGGSGGTEIVPGRLVDKIEHRTDDEVEGGQTRRGREFADHDVVRGEVQGRDDDPKSDGLGNCLFDPKAGRRGRWRRAVLPVGPWRAGGRAEWRRAPPQLR